jgi:hypothetical protein
MLAGSYYYGQVPPAPTCTASDAVSGIASCIVTGYGAGLGMHSLTATATDNAGRTSSITTVYTVVSGDGVRGFFSPIGGAGVINTMPAGRSVELKFEVFKGTTELTKTNSVRMSVASISCPIGALEDEVDFLTTGRTLLRYQGGQFVYRWQTPKSRGGCYKVTARPQFGTSASAIFRLR